MLKHGSKISRLRTASSVMPVMAANRGTHNVFTCITPRSAEPSVFRLIVPGLPPSTTWMDGKTRGGR